VGKETPQDKRQTGRSIIRSGTPTPDFGNRYNLQPVTDIDSPENASLEDMTEAFLGSGLSETTDYAGSPDVQYDIARGLAVERLKKMALRKVQSPDETPATPPAQDSQS